MRICVKSEDAIGQAPSSASISVYYQLHIKVGKAHPVSYSVVKNQSALEPQHHFQGHYPKG